MQHLKALDFNRKKCRFSSILPAHLSRSFFQPCLIFSARQTGLLSFRRRRRKTPLLAAAAAVAAAHDGRVHFHLKPGEVRTRGPSPLMLGTVSREKKGGGVRCAGDEGDAAAGNRTTTTTPNFPKKKWRGNWRGKKEWGEGC